MYDYIVCIQEAQFRVLNGWYAGQSSAVAAQYLLSGQQNQLASGQHPAGQSVSSGPQSAVLVFTALSGFTRLAGWYVGQSTSGGS